VRFGLFVDGTSCIAKTSENALKHTYYEVGTPPRLSHQILILKRMCPIRNVPRRFGTRDPQSLHFALEPTAQTFKPDHSLLQVNVSQIISTDLQTRPFPCLWYYESLLPSASASLRAQKLQGLHIVCEVDIQRRHEVVTRRGMGEAPQLIYYGMG
jgi:hypothetical protein